MSGYRPEHLVLIPGAYSTKATWDLLIPHLPGGVTAHPVTYPAIDDLHGIADALLADLPEHFAVAGQSLGGQVALAVHDRAPDRVDNLIVIGMSDGPEIDQGVSQSLQTQKAVGFDAFAEGFIHTLGFEGAAADVARARFHEYGAERADAHLRAILSRPDWSDSLSALAVPSLFIGMTADQVVPTQGVRELAARAAGSDYREISDCGHTPHVERPADLAATIVDWWDSLG